MKIAVTYDNGEIFQHFGHTESFKIYNIENGVITSSEVINTNGSGHGALADFLKENKVTTLICGGIGGGARQALDNAEIQIYGGVHGSADTAVATLLDGKLSFDPDAKCQHHEHEHGGDCGKHEHSCGEHRHGGCGHHGECGK